MKPSPKEQQLIRLQDVSKFYGDVLGVNRMDVDFEPGITGLVGPNGAGKSTLMHLIAGLTRPSRGRIRVLGIDAGKRGECERLYARLGYCPQHDAFPPALTGRRFLAGFTRLRGFSPAQADRLVDQALERVGLTDEAQRPIDAYSKGMRQRIKLAWAICHQPSVLILDEPLNGLDPQARAEAVAVFREFGEAGAHVLISSHILHDLNAICDRMTFLHEGAIVAEGDMAGLDERLAEQSAPVRIRAEDAAAIAARLFADGHLLQAELHEDQHGLTVRVRDADAFLLAFNQLVVREGWRIEAIGPADETARAAYRHWVTDGAP